MECHQLSDLGRIYLPASGPHLNEEDFLTRYVTREFPSNGKSIVYSVPEEFQKTGEHQANLAEKIIFENLLNLPKYFNQTEYGELWMVFFHSASYAGFSQRNHRVGKLMIREHDFVLFAKHKGKYYIALLEVKSTNDQNDHLEKKSDSKLIKNNKRSAQHQLRDHMEIIKEYLHISNDINIQCYIMWPFLTSTTTSPNRETMKRWQEDGNLHAFQDTIQNAERFSEWFFTTVLAQCHGINEKLFNTLLNRYIILSCGTFVDEINQGMLAVLTQSQLKLLNSNVCRCRDEAGPMIVHGAAGTGKTMLVLRKLQQLYQTGQLNEQNRALYICYWPGIRCYVQECIKKMGLEHYVDTVRFFISQSGFLCGNNKSYKHVFMDEAEAICLAFSAEIVKNTCEKIYKRYHDGNCTIGNCPNHSDDIIKSMQNHEQQNWGELWFLVDINQASLFLPKQSPEFLKVPTIVLNQVMRCTKSIFDFFTTFYHRPLDIPLKIPNIFCGHNVIEPAVFWVDSNNFTSLTVSQVIIDLCATKGFKPNDICVLPFLINENLTINKINSHIEEYFVENGFKPIGINDVDEFVKNHPINNFLFSWVLKVKGLEFKVVILSIDGDDFDENDAEDRKKLYIMASRCTCMLIVVCNDRIRDDLNLNRLGKQFPFSMKFH